MNYEKIKDRDTGGQQTELGNPLLFDFNNGLGFKIGGVDAIKRRSNPMSNELQTFYRIKE